MLRDEQLHAQAPLYLHRRHRAMGELHRGEKGPRFQHPVQCSVMAYGLLDIVLSRSQAFGCLTKDESLCGQLMFQIGGQV